MASYKLLQKNLIKYNTSYDRYVEENRDQQC